MAVTDLITAVMAPEPAQDASAECVAGVQPARSGSGLSALLGSIALAACALPGVMPTAAHAEEAPEQGVVSFKFSAYGDSQPKTANSKTTTTTTTVSSASGGGGGGVSSWLGLGGENNYSRIKVITPSVYALVPLNRQWAIEGSFTYDAVSGASPAYYTDMAGAADMKDQRKAGDLKLTRYFDRQAVALGLAHSKEADYVSKALSLEGRWASEDNNTTWNAGVGLTRDGIDPSNRIVSHQTKNTNEFQVGVTQAWSRYDLVQASVTLSRANGYMNDPYKYRDARPRTRNADILQLRWNHWLGDSVLKSAYRFYRDSYQIKAHTLETSLVLPVTSTLKFTPSLRYYTQGAASFYVDPSPSSSTYPDPVGSPQYFSADPRLSAFGAITLGGKLEWQFAQYWSADAKLEWYRQNTQWRLGGQGSTGLDPLTAVTIQLGVSRQL